MFNFWWLAEQSEPGKMSPKSSNNEMLIFGLHSTCDDEQKNVDGRAIWAKNIDGNAKKWKKPLSHWKMKCSFLDYVQLLMIGWAIQAKNVDQNTKKNKKGPLSHWKIKCSFLDYVQLLMISWVIQAKNVDWNAKKWKRPPKSLKNQMFIFGLCSTYDDQLSNLSKKHWLKCKKMKKAP